MLSPSAIVRVKADTTTMSLAKAEVLVPALSPVPASIAVSTDGLIRTKGDYADKAKCFTVAGVSADEGSAKWIDATDNQTATADATGAALFFY